ncbi:hypothetical protein FA95DRAFT_1532985 [Auriscalpium vulgare]|uniref:Uncharacterized protein n=1 Tax=Auriscalpium vulgare TaxID=40419 RepID=A0ACB8S8F5_9AGAM|nr:hypothetical protein FA95DRAFT_1532985 [Auriscalpium vulgare]
MASPYRAPSVQHNSDTVPGDQYRYALTNFAIAHQKVEEQRSQLEQQEKQIAMLRQRVATLEGSAVRATPGEREGGNSVDDFSIKNSASVLERSINRWATEIVRTPPASLGALHNAALTDLLGDVDPGVRGDARPMVVQNLLRHAMAETISEGVLNCLIVQNVPSSGTIDRGRTRPHPHAVNPTVGAARRVYSSCSRFFDGSQYLSCPVTRSNVTLSLPTPSAGLMDHVSNCTVILNRVCALALCPLPLDRDLCDATANSLSPAPLSSPMPDPDVARTAICAKCARPMGEFRVYQGKGRRGPEGRGAICQTVSSSCARFPLTLIFPTV